jgi:WhiB family redox-sensing transcriptional regulator
VTDSRAVLSEQERGQVEGAGPGQHLRLRPRRAGRQDSGRQDSGRQDSGRQERACWRESAACRFLETELFFPIGKTGLAVAEIERAKAVCADCPVRQPCLTFALDTHQGYGIWGGYDEDERRVMLRQRRKA